MPERKSLKRSLEEKNRVDRRFRYSSTVDRDRRRDELFFLYLLNKNLIFYFF